MGRNCMLVLKTMAQPLRLFRLLITAARGKDKMIRRECVKGPDYAVNEKLERGVNECTQEKIKGSGRIERKKDKGH